MPIQPKKVQAMEPGNVAIEVLDEGIEESAENLEFCCSIVKSRAQAA
jgi:hypothetical protein